MASRSAAGPPRCPASSGHTARRCRASVTSAGPTGRIRLTTSAATSASRPPEPSVSSQPTGGSRRISISNSATASPTYSSTNNLVSPDGPARRSTACATPSPSTRPTATPSTSVLWATPVALTTTGYPIRDAASTASNGGTVSRAGSGIPTSASRSLASGSWTILVTAGSNEGTGSTGSCSRWAPHHAEPSRANSAASLPRTATRPASAAAASTAPGRFSAIDAAITPGVPVVRLAATNASKVGHQVESSNPPDGKSRTSIAASNGPSRTVVKVAVSRSRSPQMNVW